MTIVTVTCCCSKKRV